MGLRCRPWRVTTLAALGALPSACALLAGIDGPQPRADAGPPDAAPRDTLSRPSETSADTRSVDRGADVAHAGPSWCATQTATFCEDFDEQPSASDFLGTWSNFQQSGGSFSFDTMDALSKPNALRATGTKGARVLVVKTFPALTTRPSALRLSFSLRINAPGASNFGSVAGFAGIVFGSGISSGYVILALGGSLGAPRLAGAWAIAMGTKSGDAGPFNVANEIDAFPALGAWNAYAIEIDFAGAEGCLHAFQGPTELLVPCMTLPPSLTSPHVISIALGDYAAGLGDTGDVDVEFDNVTYDVTP